MGHGHLGIIPLPKTDDLYEQPSINFYVNQKKDKEKNKDGEYREIELLIFGGCRFKEKNFNQHEYTDQCFVLTIPPRSNTYKIKYLPGAKLRTPDKFFNNMQVRCDINKNTVTVIGQKAAHRINTGKRKQDLHKLKWK